MRSLLQFLGWGSLTVFAFLFAAGVPIRQALANTIVPALTKTAPIMNCATQCSCNAAHTKCVSGPPRGCQSQCMCTDVQGVGFTCASNK